MRLAGKFGREKIAVAQPCQFGGKIDKAFRDHVNDEAGARDRF